MRTASRNNTRTGGILRSQQNSSFASSNTSPRGGLGGSKANERVVRSPPRQKGNKQLAPKQKENGRKGGAVMQPKQSMTKKAYEVIEVAINDSTFVKSDDESSPKRTYQLSPGSGPNPTLFSNHRDRNLINEKTSDCNVREQNFNFAQTQSRALNQISSQSINEKRQEQVYSAASHFIVSQQQNFSGKFNPSTHQMNQQSTHHGSLISNNLIMKLKSENEDLNFSDEYSLSDGDVDITSLVVSKQVPKIQTSFNNAFQSYNRPSIEVRDNTFEEAITLDRILQQDGGKISKAERVTKTTDMMSTQACTFQTKGGLLSLTNRKKFDVWQLSPTRITAIINLVKLPLKIVPNISVGEITRSSAGFLNTSSHSGQSCAQIIIECAEGGLITNTSAIEPHAFKVDTTPSHQRMPTIENSDLPLFYNALQSEQAPITHQSCLHGSFDNDDHCCEDHQQNDSPCSSCGSSFLEGGNACSKNKNCSCCQVNFNNSNTLKSQLQNRFMINLETIMLQEIKVWTIYQALHDAKQQNNFQYLTPELMSICEDWWSVTKDSSSLFEIYKIYRDTLTRKTLRRAMILESLIIVLTAFFIQQAETPLKSQDQIKLLKRLTRLYHLCHQNLCHIICLVIQRMGVEQCESNIWAIQLKQVVQTKLQPISNAFDMLTIEETLRCDEFTRNNHKIFKYLKQLQVLQERRTGNASIIFTNVSYIFQEIEKTHINRVKDIMISALNQEAIMLQQRKITATESLQQKDMDLACQEEIQLPQQYTQQNHLSTINEDDTSYCSEFKTPVPPKKLPGQTSLNPPYLPANNEGKKYTLVLDLDETLIHYVEEAQGNCTCNNQEHEDPNNCNCGDLNGQFLVRPGALNFLKEMAEHFEIVIFTAAVQDYADWVLDQLDTEGYISYRLYRQHALAASNFFIKDLSRLGRDISKTLIVDNVAENFQLQPDNGVFIRTWIDDPTDNALDELAPLLKEIAVRNVKDVREALRVFRIQMMEQVQKGILKPKLSLADGLVEIENPEDVYDSPIKKQ